MVAAVWAVAVVTWLWLVVVGSVHAWATRTGRRRCRYLTGAVLPAVVRRRIERLALAGLLLAPAAACADGSSGSHPAPVLVLEETIPLAPPTVSTTRSSRPLAAVPAPPATTVAPPTTTAPAATGLAPPDPAPDPSAPSPTVVPGPSTPALPPPIDAPPQPSGVATDPDAADLGPDPLFDLATEPGSHVVRRGEHLWSIAADHLATLLGRRPSVTEIDPYWREVVAANAGTIRSGDPNLIHPGEVVRLPALRS